MVYHHAWNICKFAHERLQLEPIQSYVLLASVNISERHVGNQNILSCSTYIIYIYIALYYIILYYITYTYPFYDIFLIAIQIPMGRFIMISQINRNNPFRLVLKTHHQACSNRGLSHVCDHTKGISQLGELNPSKSHYINSNKYR